MIGSTERRIKEKSKKWVTENKERMKELQSNWYKKNKIKSTRGLMLGIIIPVQTSKKKIKNYRTAINHMLRGVQKTNKYIGCKRGKLIEWMEFRFEDDMTMENYRTYWTVDHVIPLDIIKTDENLFDMIVKWNNIMPVHTKFNLVK